MHRRPALRDRGARSVISDGASKPAEGDIRDSEIPTGLETIIVLESGTFSLAFLISQEGDETENAPLMAYHQPVGYSNWGMSHNGCASRPEHLRRLRDLC